jgi:hypothetical protein
MSVSKLYDINGRMLNGCESVCEMRLRGENEVLGVYGENLHKCYFLHLDGTGIQL